LYTFCVGIEQARHTAEPKKEATQAQLAAAQISFYFDLLEISDITARTYATSVGVEKN